MRQLVANVWELDTNRNHQPHRHLLLVLRRILRKQIPQVECTEPRRA
jgi:hypothetical protein